MLVIYKKKIRIKYNLKKTQFAIFLNIIIKCQKYGNLILLKFNKNNKKIIL